MDLFLLVVRHVEQVGNSLSVDVESTLDSVILQNASEGLPLIVLNPFGIQSDKISLVAIPSG